MLCGSELILGLVVNVLVLTMISFRGGSPRARSVQEVWYVFDVKRSTMAITNPLLGVVYEKRLIEQFINENGTEPDSGEALSAEDLLPIHSSRIVRPRPPTLTSIPALLATFQNEWDALALETYNIKEQLARTREELATALYQHDAAVRVIARLTRERDEARDALSKVTVSGGVPDGDSMMVDSVEKLPEELAAKVEETHKSYVDVGLVRRIKG